MQQGDILGTVFLFGGKEDRVQVLAAEEFSYCVAEGEQVEILLSSKGFDYAPVVAGANAGHAYICLDGKVVGKIPVCYEITVEQQ